MRRIIWRKVRPASVIGWHYRFHTESFTPKKFTGLCENLFSRFAENPPAANYLLLQHDLKKQTIAFASKYPIEKFVPSPSLLENNNIQTLAPTVTPISNLWGCKNSDDRILLFGQTPTGCNMIGRPLCDIEWTPIIGSSKQCVFYSFAPYISQNMPIHIPRFNNSIETQKLQNEKGGKYKSGELKINNKDVLKRNAIKKRDPDQNEVMNSCAVEEYHNCAKEYGKYLYSSLTTMLFYSASIVHLSTLRTKEKNREKVSDHEKNIAHRDRLLRPEWLHLLSFSLHPMHLNPQHTRNLAAARGCDNTRMMLLEYVVKWFALNVPFSQNYLNARFDLVLDTHVIDTIYLTAMININGTQFKLTQKIDTLALNPEQISASDLAGLIAILNLLAQGTKPVSQEIVNIKSSPARHLNANFFEYKPISVGDGKQQLMGFLNRS